MLQRLAQPRAKIDRLLFQAAVKSLAPLRETQHTPKIFNFRVLLLDDSLRALSATNPCIILGTVIVCLCV